MCERCLELRKVSDPYSTRWIGSVLTHLLDHMADTEPAAEGWINEDVGKLIGWSVGDDGIAKSIKIS